MKLPRSARVLSSSLALAGFSLLAAPAAAQTEGFAIDRFDPSERGSDWFANESLDLRGNMRPAIGIVGDWAYKPLVIYDANGDEDSALIEHQLFVHVGGSLVLFERLRLGVNLPLAVYQAGESGTVANSQFSSADSTSVGDVRFGADVRIVGAYGDVATLAGGVQLWAPTGSREQFTGDGKVRVGPRLMLAGDISSFTYSARMGFVYRGQDEGFANTDTGSEAIFGLAAGARVADGNLVIGPELYGSTVTSDFFARRTTPFEIVFGGHYKVAKDWRIGAGVGPGLTRGIGSPKVRGLLSIEWHPSIEEEQAAPPPPPPADRDSDGVLDKEDACPDVPGERTDDPKTNGCPPPGDRDGDGVTDDIDACPDTPGVKTDDPKTNGCPPPDRDGDGVLDQDDACPDEAGVKTDDPKTNGCPPPKDRDGDSILDDVDACPDTPGPANADPKKNGCPIARVEKGQIRITERIEFEYNSDKLRPESDEVLNAVLKILNENPAISKISVEGHTDNKGNDRYNKALSNRRAASVAKWLTKNGIDKKRLVSKGLGEEKPIDTNSTEEGRQNNRRVEFHIQEMDGKPVDSEGKPAAEPEGGAAKQ